MQYLLAYKVQNATLGLSMEFLQQTIFKISCHLCILCVFYCEARKKNLQNSCPSSLTSACQNLQTSALWYVDVVVPKTSTWITSVPKRRDQVPIKLKQQRPNIVTTMKTRHTLHKHQKHPKTFTNTQRPFLVHLTQLRSRC